MEFELREDAEAAVDNMDKGELFGRVLTVNIARAKSIDKSKAGVLTGFKFPALEHILTVTFVQCGIRIQMSIFKQRRRRKLTKKKWRGERRKKKKRKNKRLRGHAWRRYL